MSSTASSDDDDDATTSFRDKPEWLWAQKLARRLEQVLHVHPEKYQNGCSSQRASRQSSPDHNSNHNHHVRSRSAEFGRAAEMSSNRNELGGLCYDDGQDQEIKGMLLMNGDEILKHHSPQRGTPGSSVTNFNQETIVTINISGMRFQTFESTLSRYPNSLLGDPSKRRHYYISETNEYFFDRHRTTFESILYIYQSGGRVKRPEMVPIDIFLREMRFFQMGDKLLEEFWIAEGYEKPKEVDMPKNKTQRKIWELMEYPDSSLSARIVAFISITVIAVSIISFCWETVPNFSSSNDIDTRNPFNSPFFWVELVCILWFTVELFLRFISCPSKLTFVMSILNIIDFIAIAPFFVNLLVGKESNNNTATTPTPTTESSINGTASTGSVKSSTQNPSMSFAVLRVLRLVRVFRVFKLSRHSVGLQILGKTFRASIQEFCLLIFFMAIALVLFASGMYYAEQGANEKFSSIPASFWFVLVTMTTVGYGDLYPMTTLGKVVGGMCAMIGVLTLALPVPIIVANFKHFYRQENRLASMKSSPKDDEEEEYA